MTNKLQFPGLKPLGAPDESAPAAPPREMRSAPLDPANPLAGIGPMPGNMDEAQAAMNAALQLLPPEISKAFGIIQQALTDNVSLVVIGIKPTKTGADFFTALHGDQGDLLAAKDELPGVIERLYRRKGLTP